MRSNDSIDSMIYKVNNTRKCRCHFQSVIMTDMSMHLIFLLLCRSLYSLYGDNHSNSHLLSIFLLTYRRFFFCLMYVLPNYCVYVYISHVISISFSYLLLLLQLLTTIHIMLHIDACFACKVINVRTNLLFIDC